MKKLLAKIRRILRDRRTRRFLTRFVSGIAAIVVFVTTYALVLPAITMESEALCGIEAHQHDDSCYSENLICGQEESEGHHHIEDCYTVTRELVCQLQEHRHSAENNCFDEEGNLVCTLEEHTHADSCYEEHRELTCGLEETEGHQHTDSCYEKVLTCGKEVHTHSADCYRADLEIQSAAVASTGTTSASAAAFPDEEYFTEDSQNEGPGSEGWEEAVQDVEEDETADEAAAEENSVISNDSDDEGRIEEEDTASDIGSAEADNDFAAENGDANTGNDSIAAEDDDASADNDSIAAENDEADIDHDGIAAEDDDTDTDNNGIVSEDDDAGKDNSNETADTDNTDAEDPADNINEDTEKDTNTDKGEEDAASSFSTGFAADENEENGDAYIPEKEELYFNTVINRRTGIYYHHVAEDESIEDSSAITGWARADEDTRLNPEDVIRIYLSYTLPKDTINATNDIARYRLPDTLHLTDDQIDAINSCENGISGQYMDFDTLEITDPERHAACLGLESVEGSRCPDEELKEDSQEFISATVRAEKRYNEDTGEYEGTDLIFTFSPYTVEKNAHAYDKDGQPTRAGEEVSGWLTLDFNMSQIEWAEDRTSEIVFAEEDQENNISGISTVLTLADPSESEISESDDSAANGTAEEAAADVTSAAAATDAAAETAATDMTAEIASTADTAEIASTADTVESAAEDSTAAAAAETAAAATTAETAAENSTAAAAAGTEKESEKDKDKKEEPAAANYPTAVFDDSITVRSGRLDTDLADTDLPKKTKMTVHVEADEGTFPEGTRMVLSAVEDLDAVAEAVGTAVDGKTRGFQAVDITFYDKDPSAEDAKEIEPLKPIRVSIKSDEIKKAAGDASTAPVVVHIEDNNTAAEVESRTASNDAGTDEAVSFEADSFSVYAIVYAVDFHAKVISANGETYEITVTCGEDAQIPYGSELKVREILPEDEEYESLYNDAVEAANSDAKKQGIEIPVVSDARLFDIEIQGPEGKIEPAAPVQVSIRLIGSTSEVLSVVHFAEQGPESMELVEKSAGDDETKGNTDSAEGTPRGEEDASEPVSEVSFVATSFSVYSVIGFDNSVDLVNDGPFVLTSVLGPSMFTADDPDDKDVLKYALTSDIVTGQNNVQTLGGKVVYQHTGTSQADNYMGGSVTEWYFEKYNNNPDDHRYYIYTLDSDGTKQYIYSAQNQNILLKTNRNNDCLFTVEESGGKIRLHINYANYSWSISNNRAGGSDYASSSYFTTVSGSGNNTLFTLGKRNPDYDEKAAKKVSAEDYNAGIGNPGNWNAGSVVVIYRRVVHDDGSELLYALATDGTWVPAYDGGDSIYYHCPEGKDVRWTVRHEEDGYHVTSKDGTVSLAPSKTDNTWSVNNSEGVGLTMLGLGSDYGSQIEVWDQAEYAYAGLHLPLNNSGQIPSPTTKVQPGIEDESDTFLFAVIPDESLVTQGTKHEVQTVDSDALGITIKMYNYTDTNTYHYGYRQGFMQSVLGDDMRTDWDTRKFFVTKMVEDTLNTSGYPVSLTNGSLENLFKAGTYNYGQFSSWNGYFWETVSGGTGTVTEKKATNLFLQSYYDESGMFRYSSLENYAYLTSNEQNANGAYKFDVYREAGTPNIPQNNDQYYFYHGHFMPYNELDETQDLSRIVDQYGFLEDPEAGRVYDDLYGVKSSPDYYFGMTMEAKFVQPEDGTLANGNPVIYRFTGDDDLWVFIDGVKVLDVSGIHEALTGSINFETGIVEQPDYYDEGGTAHGHHEVTLYKLFSDAGIADQYDWVDVDNDDEPDTFADYTTHTFKMFYLERGAGASNLDLQFNLQVVKEQEFTVEKKLPDDVDARFVNQTYRYRATYIDEHTHQEKPLFAFKDGQGNTHASTDSQGHVVCTKVIYKDRKDEHGQPIEVPVPINDQGYFELKPGEGAVFTMKDQTTEYNVREVGIDRDLVSQVDINNNNNVTIRHNNTYGDYAEAGVDTVMKRSHVVYRNHPYVQNLRITKHITDDSLEYDSDNPPVFEFRVYLETTETVIGQDGTTQEVHKLVPYSYGPYYLALIPEGQENNESAWTYYKLTGENNKPMPQSGKVICSRTGRSGSINSIPPEYTIIIPDLAIGTHFYVEERRDNIPGGYEFDHEELQEGTYDDPSIEHIERIIARDEEDHQEFDPNTVGKIRERANGQGVDAWSHIYNRRPAVEVPVEKEWNPAIGPDDPVPDPVEVALVRYKGPEHAHKPEYGKGAIHINHRYALYVDGDNETIGSMPENFVAEYTILDSDGNVVAGPTINRGPFDLDPGTYTVHTEVKRPQTYNGYDHDTTPDVTEVTVSSDTTTEIEVQTRYVNPDAEKGYITIGHEFSGWESTQGQSTPFPPFYVIFNANDDVVLYTETPGTYPVDPGTYTVLMGSVNGSYNTAGYTCLDEPYAEKTQTVTVANAETQTVTFTNTYEPQQAQQGTITIRHTSNGLPGTTALPNGFQATYTIMKGDAVVQENAQLGVPYTVTPGTYTVTANVSNPAAPNGYTHTGTASVTVGVNNGENETANLVSNYSPQQVQDGYIIISHTSSGLPNTTALPNGFQATYTITNANGQVIQNNAQRGVPYPVAPGNYRVSANVSYGAAPSAEYLYAGTTPNPADVTVTSGNTATAAFVSTYQPARVTTVSLYVGYSAYGDQYTVIGSPLTVPINSTLNLKYHGFNNQWNNPINPGWQLLSWNGYSWDTVDGASGNVPENQGVNIQLGEGNRYCVLIQTDRNNANRLGASLTQNQTASALQQIRHALTSNPFTVTAYADEVSDKAAAGTASYSADVRQKAYQSPGVGVPMGYKSDSGIIRNRRIDDDEEPVLRDGPNNGETNIAPLSTAVQQKVYQAVGGSSNIPAGYTLDTGFGQSFILSDSSNWAHVFEELPEIDEYGNVYYYALVEINVPEDYTASYTNNPISAREIRENKEAQEGDNPPELMKLTATNLKKTGNLKLVKAIAPGSDAETTYRFYFKVTLNGADPSRLKLDGEDISESDISTDENGVTTVYVTFIGKESHTLSGIIIGTTYEVVELDETGHAMPANWQQKGNVAITSDIENGANNTIAADETETATITNEETGTVEATKTWSPENPGNIAIYFKIYYQRTVTPENGDPYVETIAVPGQQLKEIPPSQEEFITVQWDDLPIYMDDGSEYIYVVKEFIRDDSGEYLDPYTNLTYTEAAPEGYVKVENGLSITNTRSEDYNPKTNYTGTKTWVDTNKTVRPESLHVTLMIDDGDGVFENDPDDQPATYLSNGQQVPYEAQWTQGEGELSDQWFYTFKDLPIFDEDGNAIEYYVIESPAGGYDQTSTHIKEKVYIRLDTKDNQHVGTDGSRDRILTLRYETDLPFVAIMSRNNATQYNTPGHTYLHHVWTPRQLVDDEERQAVLNAVNEDLNIPRNEIATLQNTRFVTGQPTGDPAVAVDGHPDRHKVDFMYRANTQNTGYRVEIHQSDDKNFALSFFNRTQFDNICYGYLNYSYTHGETNITNTQVPTTFNALKTWGNDVPPEGAVVKLTLKASTTEREFTNLAEEIGIAAEYQTITLNGKSDVTTVTDSETQELISDTENTSKSHEDSAWHAVWTDLPQYDSRGKQIHYSVKEILYTIGETTVNIGEDGFTPTYTEGSPYVVTNRIPTIQKSAKKLWDESQGETLPDGVKVTLTLSAKYKESGASISLDQLNISPASVELDGIVSEDADEPETARTLWAYTWKDLPEYYNGKEVEYTIAETGYEINGVPYTVAEPEETPPEGYSNFDYVFTNTLPTVSVDATKIWKNHEGETITDTINNVEVWFELQTLTETQTGDEQWTSVLKDASGNNITNPVKRDGSENPKWKVSWTNLPKFRDGEIIRYRVKETQVRIETDSQSGAIALNPADPEEVVFPAASDSGTSAGTVEPDTGTASIINQLPSINVSVNKLWGAAGAEWPDARISVRMKLMQENAQQEIVPLPDNIVQYTDPTAANRPYGYVTITDSSRQEWDDLPMYYDNGDLIKYKVVEDAVFFTPEGGSPIEIDIEDFFDMQTMDWIDSNGHRFFTVNNKPKVTEINVTKVWTMNGDHRTDKTAIVYKLYSKEGETTQEIDLTEIGDRITASVGEMTLNQIKYIPGETSGTWQIIKIPGLPMFRMKTDPDAAQPVTFAPITYYVEEDSAGSGLAAGTVTSYSGNGAAETSTAEEAAITEGTITIYNRDDFDINLLKIDEATRDADHPTVIPDAGFQLKRFVESLAATGSNDPYENVGTEQFTDAEGKISFSGAGAGKYKIVETTPPAGYIKTDEDEDIYFIVNIDGTLTWTDRDYHPIDPDDPDVTRPARISYDDSTITFTAGNVGGAALPYTGGPGTSLFYILGGAIVIFAAVILGMRRTRH